MKQYPVNDGKGRCYQIGRIEVIAGGSMYRFSIAFGKILVVLVGEQNANSNNPNV
jgi:hypothetical protein